MTSSDQNISNELLKKIEACTSPEELEASLEEEGIDLSDEALAAIAGGIIIPSGEGSDIRTVIWKIKQNEHL